MMVSACIIAYNHEVYIRDCLDGAISQILDFEYEIVIGEDCSTDKTYQICEEYALKYPNKIRLIKRDLNVGMIGNWIETIKSCNGKYIAICEGDDYWTDPLKLQKQVDYLENNSDYVITYSDLIAFNSNGTLPNNFGGILRDVDSEDLQKGISLNTLTTCFRNIIKIYPSEMVLSAHGDIFLWSMLGSYGKGKYLDTILPSMYRVHDGGVHSMKSQEDRLRMSIRTFMALYQYHNRIKNFKISIHFRLKILKLKVKLMVYSISGK